MILGGVYGEIFSAASPRFVCRTGSSFRGGVHCAGARAGAKRCRASPACLGLCRLENPPPPPPPPTDGDTIGKIPGSTQSFTMKQIRDNGNPVDWFPGDHPAVPTIVSHRRSPGLNPWIGSCGWCHLVNGHGRPENAGVAGLPAGYIHGATRRLQKWRAENCRSWEEKYGITMSGNAAGITNA